MGQAGSLIENLLPDNLTEHIKNRNLTGVCWNACQIYCKIPNHSKHKHHKEYPYQQIKTLIDRLKIDAT